MDQGTVPSINAFKGGVLPACSRRSQEVSIMEHGRIRPAFLRLVARRRRQQIPRPRSTNALRRLVMPEKVHFRSNRFLLHQAGQITTQRCTEVMTLVVGTCRRRLYRLNMLVTRFPGSIVSNNGLLLGGRGPMLLRHVLHLIRRLRLFRWPMERSNTGTTIVIAMVVAVIRNCSTVR